MKFFTRNCPFIYRCIHCEFFHKVPPPPPPYGHDFANKKNQTTNFSRSFLEDTLTDYQEELSDSLYAIINDRMPDMLMLAEEYAKPNLNKIITASAQTISNLYLAYINRYEYLHKINHHIQQKDINAIKEEKSQLEKYIKTARLRLDAVRLIIQGL